MCPRDACEFRAPTSWPCRRPRGPLAALTLGSKWGERLFVMAACIFRIYHERGWGSKDFGTPLWSSFPRCYIRRNHDVVVSLDIFDHIWIHSWDVYRTSGGYDSWNKYRSFLFPGPWNRQGNAPVVTLAGHPGKIARVQSGNTFWV